MPLPLCPGIRPAPNSSPNKAVSPEGCRLPFKWVQWMGGYDFMFPLQVPPVFIPTADLTTDLRTSPQDTLRPERDFGAQQSPGRMSPLHQPPLK